MKTFLMRFSFTLIVLIFGLNHSLWCQTNLVQNPGFENFTTCPVGFSEFNGYVQTWVNPSAASPDYYNTCAGSFPAGIPKNGTGYQQSHSGNAYAGIYATGGTYREFVQVQLSSQLVAGRQYTVSFYVNLHNKSQWATDDLGAYLSATAPSSTGTGFLTGNPSPQIGNAVGNIITDTLNWTLITGNYNATGGERYITLGHFRTDATTNYQQVNFGTQGAYYYFDDVSVIESAPLPVSLISFEANYKDESVFVEWKTASEINNDYFEIQRSFDGNEFATIAYINGNGTTTELHEYFYSDKTIKQGKIYYYRLLQVDFDGKSSFSKPVVVKTKNEILVFPNPFNEHLFVSLKGNERFQISLIDVRGNVVIHQAVTQKYFEMSTEAISEGVYFLRIVSDNDVSEVTVVK